MPRMRLVPLWIYLVLAVSAIAYAYFKEVLDPAHSEFAGLPLIILGLPWSVLWRNFNPKFVRSEYQNSIIVESMFIALNGILLWLVITVASRIFGRVPGSSVSGGPSRPR